MQNKFIEKNIMVKIMVQNNGKNKSWNPENLSEKKELYHSKKDI